LDDASPLVVLETARAIHDAPIPAALEALARRIKDTMTMDDAVLRRVLNANYRLGSQEHADALGAYASRPIAPLEMRREAIEMLRQWSSTDPRDRVLGDHRPIATRSNEMAKLALGKSLPSILQNADEIRELAVSVAAEFGMPEVTPFLEQRVADRNLRPESRAVTLAALARLQPEKAAAVALTLLDASQIKLRIAAFETIAAIKPAIAIEPLAKATKSEAVIERQAAWDTLAKIK
jgi:quinoprotein glucose dehydrogenase